MVTTLTIFLASKLHIVIVVVALFVFITATHDKKRMLFIYGVFGLPLAYILGKIAGLLYFTPRPFAELGIAPLVPHIADNGFPSEHTLYAMTIALVVYFANKKVGVMLILLALLVGVGRVLAEVHRPIDVLGSVSIAVFVVCAVRYLTAFEMKPALLQET